MTSHAPLVPPPRGIVGVLRPLAIAAALLGLGAGTAAAQHHHHDHGTDGGSDAAVTGAAGLAVETGHVEAFGERREYQGVAFMGSARIGSFELAAHLPLYRIELGPESHAGLGDVHLEAGWIALHRPVEAGVTLAVMPPLGSDEYGLAMGHWMLMGGAFARASRGRASGSLSLGYSSTLGGEGHAEHGVPAWPPVSPMNAREIRAVVGARVALWRWLGAAASASAAAPVGDGDFLAQAGGGLVGQIDRFEVGVEASHGLAGHTAGLVVGSHFVFAF